MAGNDLRRVGLDDSIAFDFERDGVGRVRINGADGSALSIGSFTLQAEADPAKGVRLTIIQLDTSDGTVRRLRTIYRVEGSASLRLTQQLKAEYLPEEKV